MKIHTKSYVGIRRKVQCSSVQRLVRNHGGRFNGQIKCENGDTSAQRMPKDPPNCAKFDDPLKELAKTVVKRLITEDLTFSDWIQSIIQLPINKTYQPTAKNIMPTQGKVPKVGGKEPGGGNPKDTRGVTAGDVNDGVKNSVKNSSMGAWGQGGGASLFKTGDDKGKNTPKNPVADKVKAWGSVKPAGKAPVTKSASKTSGVVRDEKKASKTASRQHTSKKTKSNDGKPSAKTTGTQGAAVGTPARSSTPEEVPQETPVKANGKRTAKTSPKASPEHQGRPGQDPTFPVRNLDAKLKSVAGKDTLSPEEAAAILNDEQYKGELWWREEIFESLTAEVQSEKGKIYPDVSALDYVFDKNESTTKILPTVNFFAVADLLMKRCAEFKSGERLPAAHPVNGPFSLEEDKAKQTIMVLDGDGEVVLTVKRFDVELYFADYTFVMEDRLTYFTLCWRALEVVRAMNELFLHGSGQWKSMGSAAHGPFKVVEGGTEGKRYLENHYGEVLCIEPALQGQWDEIKHQYGITSDRVEQKDDSSSNKYDALSEGEEEDSDRSERSSYVDSGDSYSRGRESEDMTSGTDSDAESEKSRGSTGDESDSTGSDEGGSESESSDGSVSSAGKGDGKIARKGNKSKRGEKPGRGNGKRRKRRARTKKVSYREYTSSESESEGEDSPAAGAGSAGGTRKTALPVVSNSSSPATASDQGALGEMVFGLDEETFEPPEGDVQSDEDEDGTELNDIVIEDVQPRTPLRSSASDVSGLTPQSSGSLSQVLDPNDGVVMLATRMEVLPDTDNTERVFMGWSDILAYWQRLDPEAEIAVRCDLTGRGLKNITSPDDEYFTKADLISMGMYGFTGNRWVLKQDKLTDKQIKGQRKRDQVDLTKLSDKKRRQREKRMAKSGTRNYILEIYGSLAIKTTIKPQLWDQVIESIDLELTRSKKISISKKTMQCWDSESRVALIGAQNNFCPEGVAMTLRDHCIRLEAKYLAESKKPLDYFETELPELNVTVKKLRELELPDEERKSLTFEAFPDHTHRAFQIETSDYGWDRYGPLFDLMTRSNVLTNVFGVKAHFLTLPKGRKQSIHFTRKYHGKGQVHNCYQAASTVIECGSVANYDKEVKVRMAEVAEVDANGNPTGRMVTPPRWYSRTTLRKEMSRITVDGVKVFQACCMTMLPPEQGQSKIAVPYDPTDPRCKRIYRWAQRTIATLPSFIYCWCKEVRGYNEATTKRLLGSFYLNFQVTAHECVWHPETFSVTTSHSTYADTYLEDHMDMDPITGASKSATISFASDEQRKQLLERLNYNPDKTCDDVRTGASAVTGEDGTSAASSLRSETSLGAALGRSTSIKMDLARARKALAEKDLEFRQMRAQLETLMAARGMEVDTDVREPPQLKKTSARVGFKEGSGQEGEDQEMHDAASPAKTREGSEGAQAAK